MSESDLERINRYWQTREWGEFDFLLREHPEYVFDGRVWGARSDDGSADWPDKFDN